MAGMKKATIPAGLRRGTPSPPRAPEPGRDESTPRRGRGDRPARPASSTASGSTSGRKPAAAKRGPRPTPAAQAPPPTGGNPYAGQKRRPMNHLVYEGLSGRLRELSEALIDAGYGKRDASQAQLTNAILHFHMPADRDAAGELIAEWNALTAVPIPSNPYRGQKRRPMNHLVFERIPVRLGELSEQLIAAGYPERSASQAQLTQAILHSGMPASVDEAGELVQGWLLLLTAPA